MQVFGCPVPHVLTFGSFTNSYIRCQLFIGPQVKDGYARLPSFGQQYCMNGGLNPRGCCLAAGSQTKHLTRWTINRKAQKQLMFTCNGKVRRQCKMGNGLYTSEVAATAEAT